MTGVLLAALALYALSQRGGKPKRVRDGPSSAEARKTAEQAAAMLRIYLLGGGDPGTRYRHVGNVERAQRLMGKIRETGYVDAYTRARAANLGHALPPPLTYDTAEQAAKALAAFVQRTGRFGHDKDRPPEIRAAQRGMGMPRREQDGIVGPKTRLRAVALGVTLPARPDKYPDRVSGPYQEGQANLELSEEDSEVMQDLAAIEDEIRSQDPWQNTPHEMD